MKDFTHITVLLDSSGSMALLTNDIIGGYNSFIQEQQALGDNATISVYTFSNFVEGYKIPESIKSARFLTRATYVPVGGTALFDALIKSMADTGDYLSSMIESERPNKVLFVVITDGEENASKMGYTREQIAAKIKEQQELYNWEFIYIAANQDAFTEGFFLGIGNTVNFYPTPQGTRDMYQSVSTAVGSVRTR